MTSAHRDGIRRREGRSVLSILLAVVLLAVPTGLHGQAFVTTWKTDNTGTSASDQIRIPTAGGGYNYTVTWAEVGNPGNVGVDGPFTTATTITFPSVGTYRVEISGDFPRIAFNNGGDRLKILTIEQWGDIAWTSMAVAFYGAVNLTYNATDVPDLSGVSSMENMFANAVSFNGDIGAWDVSTVTNMRNLFFGTTSFNRDIGGWDVSAVTNMAGMFRSAAGFNSDISGWNTSNVTNMTEMFRAAAAFNQPIGAWDVSNVTLMQSMFLNATAFNQDLGAWNVAAVTDMRNMFSSASAFNGNIGGWDVSGVTDMAAMFASATSFNQPIGGWNTASVTDMEFMFYGATTFNQPIGSWDVSAVSNMASMFVSATSFDQDIGAWNVAAVTTMRDMFNNARAFNGNIGSWDVSGVTDMAAMFRLAIAFNQPIGSWNVASVTDMQQMFNNATVFNQPIGAWDVSNVALMPSMFQSATAFDQDLDAWNVAAVTTMRNMFSSALAFNGSIGSWDVSGVTDMAGMFVNATSFNQPIGGWNTGSVTTMLSMFNGATVFNQPIGSWDVGAVLSMASMFVNATSFNQDLDGWNVAAVTTMRNMFNGATAFNGSIGGWDVGSVTDMAAMFRLAVAFNQPIGGWNVASVRDMLQMFNGASVFNQPIGAWDVSSVTTMQAMFSSAPAFNQDISGWNVSAVITMRDMFRLAVAFDQPIDGWNVANVRDMALMFDGATMFNQPIDSWNTGSVTNMGIMFRNATSFDQPIGSWNIGSVTTMGSMLNGSGLSTASYDATLAGWAAFPTLRDSIPLGATGLRYCDAEAARQSLIDTHSWTITGDSYFCEPGRYVVLVSDDAPAAGGEVTVAAQLVSAGGTPIAEAGRTVNWTSTNGGSFGAASSTTDANGIATITYTVSAVVGTTHVVTATDAADAAVTGDSPIITTQSRSFVTTWKTDNAGTSGSNQITIPTTGAGYNYNVAWEEVGDTENSGIAGPFTGNATITFPSAGTYRVSISGDFPRIFFNNGGDRQKILTIEQWGDIAWTSMERAFDGASNLAYSATDVPDLSGVTSTDAMFQLASSFNGAIGDWDVSSVTSMGNMFFGASSFNQDIGGWDVGNVTNMEGLFRDATVFNQDLSAWDLNGVLNTSSMFQNAAAFNADISGWNTSTVTNMFTMFSGATSFNQPTGGWDVSAVTNMTSMFQNATSFNQDLGGWDVSVVTDMLGMFDGATAFNGDVTTWNTASLNSAGDMFKGASSFNQNLGAWDVSQVNLLSGMLDGTALSTGNYDSTLIGWAALPTMRIDRTLGVSGLTYCEGEAARQYLITTYNMTILGDALGCEPAGYLVTVDDETPVLGSTVTVTAQLVSAGGTPIAEAGRTVNWTSTNGGSFSASSSTTDGNGVATITFTVSTVAGTEHVVTATDDADANITANSPTITPQAQPATQYLVTVSDETPVVGTEVTVTAQLADANGTPVPEAGRTVVWSSTHGGSFGAPSSTTDGDGVATITFTVSTVAGTEHVVTATDDADGTMTGESPIITTHPGAASEATSTIEAAPVSIEADGASTATITVRLADAHGNLLNTGDDEVELFTTAGTLGSVTDHDNGTYTATLTSSLEAETAVITGTVNGELIDDHAEVEFVITTPPGPEPDDLVLTVELSEEEPYVGQTILVITTIENRGVGTAPDVVVNAVLDLGRLEPVSYTVSRGTFDETTGTWAIGDLGPGAVETLTVEVVVRAPEPEVIPVSGP